MDYKSHIMEIIALENEDVKTATSGGNSGIFIESTPGSSSVK